MRRAIACMHGWWDVIVCVADGLPMRVYSAMCSCGRLAAVLACEIANDQAKWRAFE